MDKVISIDKVRFNKDLEEIAEEYYYQLLSYGDICASMYAQSKVSEEDRDRFKKLVEERKNKYGFK